MPVLSSRFFAILLGVFSAYLLSEDVTTLPAFRVSAPRSENATTDQLPFSVSDVDLEALQSVSPQLTLDDALQTVPGVFILNPTNFAQDSRISIRGFGSRANFGLRGIRLLVDGIPATTPDGQGSVDGIDLGSAASIQVIRGPASALYGAASGGVMLIETEQAPESPFFEPRGTIGSYGFHQTQLKAGGEGENVNILFNATHMELDGYRAHNQTENQRLNAKVIYEPSETARLSALINLIDYPLQNDPGGLTFEEAQKNPRQARAQNVQFDSGEALQQTQVGLVYDQWLTSDHQLELRSFYTHRDFANKLPFMNGGQVTFERDFFGGGALYRILGDQWNLTTGIDLEVQDDDRQNFDNVTGQRGPLTLDQNEQVQSLGVFVVSSYEIYPSLHLTAAIRQDRVSFKSEDSFLSDGDDSGQREFDQTSPMLGVLWQVAPALALFSNVTTSFETPTTTELANPEGGGFNQTLKPQTATSFEAGLKGKSALGQRNVRYELVAFHMDIDDALVPFELDTQPDREFYRNAGKSERIGLESVIEMEFTPEMSATMTYTWSDFSYRTFIRSGEDISGNQLPGIPEHHANFALRYQSKRGVFMQWNTRLIGSFYAEDANEVLVDSYSVTDVRLGLEKTHGAWSFEPFIGLNNLFDESYFANIRINAFGGRYYEPAPNQNLYGGLRIRYTFE
jgi:iron complex outermembrane receptor protein